MHTRTNEEREFLKNIKPEISREDLVAQLRRLHLTREEKAALNEMSRKTIVVGGKVVQLGLWLMETVINIARRFPCTCAGAVVGLAIFFLIGSIPLIGPLLAVVAGPIIALITVGMGLMQDLGFQVQAMVNDTIRRYS
ncbi:MAG: hypothetical protein WCO89_00510 [Syntrophus sp. (in: bacteria)]